MKKLFVLGLILALLLISLPVLAEDGNTTVNGDVSQTNITAPAPTEVPVVVETTVAPANTTAAVETLAVVEETPG